MRQNQRDRLRMFIMNELRQLLRIGLLQRVEVDGFVADGLHQLVEDLLRVFRPEGVHQHLARIIDTALHHIVVRDGHLVELFEHAFGFFRRQRLHARDLPADDLDLVVIQFAQNLAGRFVPDHHHQNGDLADSRNLHGIFVIRYSDHLTARLAAPLLIHLTARLSRASPHHLTSTHPRIHVRTTCACKAGFFFASAAMCFVKTSVFFVFTTGIFSAISASASWRALSRVRSASLSSISRSNSSGVIGFGLPASSAAAAATSTFRLRSRDLLRNTTNPATSAISAPAPTPISAYKFLPLSFSSHAGIANLDGGGAAAAGGFRFTGSAIRVDSNGNASTTS